MLLQQPTSSLRHRDKETPLVPSVVRVLALLVQDAVHGGLPSFSQHPFVFQHLHTIVQDFKACGALVCTMDFMALAG